MGGITKAKRLMTAGLDKQAKMKNRFFIKGLTTHKELTKGLRYDINSKQKD
jgi:hypothetical protein